MTLTAQPPRVPLGTVRGEPVLISREWWVYLAQELFKRVGGSDGMSITEIMRAIDALALLVATNYEELQAEIDAITASERTGSDEIDFGAFPGKSDTFTVITDQTDIPADAVVSAWLMPRGTEDHSADEHLAESIKVFAGNVVEGVGFTIYGLNDGQGTRLYGKWSVGWNWK